MEECNHISTKKDRLPILSNWYYCHKCKSPFNKNHLIKMKCTHTKIVFCIKDEPILSMIQKEFSEFNYNIKHISSKGRYKTVELKVEKIVDFDNEDNIMMEGYKVQFEHLVYYSEP